MSLTTKWCCVIWEIRVSVPRFPSVKSHVIYTRCSQVCYKDEMVRYPWNA